MSEPTETGRPWELADWLYSWNPDSPASLRHVQVEEDTRDALQAALVRRPSLVDRRCLLDLSARIGVQVVFLGFPAASPRERADCEALLDHISTAGLRVTPVLMARAVPADVQVVLELARAAPIPVVVDLFISTSPLRRQVEDWDLDEMLGRLVDVARVVAAEGVAFRIAFEDSTRTPPDELDRAVRTAVALEPTYIVLNDTVGDCLPAGAARTVAFVCDLLSTEAPSVEVAWHGHNDKGLALANAVTAAQEGATLISGTFLGIGERAGNVPLEQFIYLLDEAGSEAYDVTLLPQMCRMFAEACDAEVSPQAPLVGEQTFTTATGTHVAAIVKAEVLGDAAVDQIFSSASALRLGRDQRLLIGPNSGRRSVRTALAQITNVDDDSLVDAVLNYCQRQDRAFRNVAELRSLVSSLRVGRRGEGGAASSPPSTSGN